MASRIAKALAVALAGVLVACGGGGSAGVGRAVPISDAVRAVPAAERDALQRSMELPAVQEAAVERRAFLEWVEARDRDAEQAALELPKHDEGTRAARDAYFRWLSERDGR